jgi:hypothetical protein
MPIFGIGDFYEITKTKTESKQVYIFPQLRGFMPVRATYIVSETFST